MAQLMADLGVNTGPEGMHVRSAHAAWSSVSSPFVTAVMMVCRELARTGGCQAGKAQRAGLGVHGPEAGRASDTSARG